MLIYPNVLPRLSYFFVKLNVNMIASLLPKQMLQLLSCFILFICLRRSSKRALFQKFESCVIGLDYLSVVEGFLLADSAERASKKLWILNPQTVSLAWRKDQHGPHLLFWKCANKAKEGSRHRDIFLFSSWWGLFCFYSSNFIVEWRKRK